MREEEDDDDEEPAEEHEELRFPPPSPAAAAEALRGVLYIIGYQFFFMPIETQSYCFFLFVFEFPRYHTNETSGREKKLRNSKSRRGHIQKLVHCVKVVLTGLAC